jgi:sulfopyruvate decarboxylase beta subunit
VPRPEEKLIDVLKNHGVDFTASLPCEKIKVLLEKVNLSFFHVPLTREEEGVGISAGAALSGRRPAMFVQSSGLGNMINALLSLTAFYQLPLALFVSRRGFYKERIEAQVPMGQRLTGILAGAGIAYSEINTKEDFIIVDRELPQVYQKNSIHAFLMSPAVWEKSECKASSEFGAFGEPFGSELRAELLSRAVRGSEFKDVGPRPSSLVPRPARPTLTRYDIIKTIAPYLEGKAVVSNLGWPSKELYALKHQPSNFYMLGSMGMATPLGLGIALTSGKEVFVIDGDGSLLMNPGTLATAADLAPRNLTIIAVDNSAYGSTGNQPTLTGTCVDLEAVARGFGFRNTVKVSSEEQILEVMKKPREGLTFIHALAIPGNQDVPNILLPHLEIKKQVQEFLKK